jgi:hypothetical protein
MRSPALTMVALSACVALAGCAAPVDNAPVVHIAEAAKPSPARPLDRVLPTADELTATLGTGGFMGQLVEGGADMLLASVRESEATPAECVSATYRLQKIVYQASPVRAVASQSWAGGSFDGPPVSGFFGVVQFATPDAAQEFFAASADKWHRCNGQTVVLHQPEHGAQGSSRVTDVTVDRSTVSAVVMRDAGSAIQRALGVAADCVVEVEITDVNHPSDAQSAVGVANVMLGKIGVS